MNKINKEFGFELSGLAVNLVVSDDVIQKRLKELQGKGITVKINVAHNYDKNTVQEINIGQVTVKKNVVDYGGYGSNEVYMTKLKHWKETSSKDVDGNPIDAKDVYQSLIMLEKQK